MLQLNEVVMAGGPQSLGQLPNTQNERGFTSRDWIDWAAALVVEMNNYGGKSNLCCCSNVGHEHTQLLHEHMLQSGKRGLHSWKRRSMSKLSTVETNGSNVAKYDRST